MVRGAELSANSHKEKLVSGLGGAISILIVYAVTRELELELHGQLLLIASMGASAVLLFAAPSSPLSQPWNVIGGHSISAFIGVVTVSLVPDPVLGSALAAGLAITAMYYLGCLHPPGGASAVIPVLGGITIANGGLIFPLFPVGLGAVMMVLVAIAYNFGFKNRRYPHRLAQWLDPGDTGPHKCYDDITHADFVAALSEIDTYVDISEDDLLRIYEIASGRAHPAISGGAS